MLLNDICSSCSKVISILASLKRIEIKTDFVGQINSNTGENSSSQSNLERVDCIVCDGGSTSITKQNSGSNVDSESQTPLIWTPNCDNRYPSQRTIFTFNESSPNYIVNNCSSPISQPTLPIVSEQDLDEVFSILNDESALNETRPDSDPIGSLESIYGNLCEYLFDSTHLENSSSLVADNERLNIKSTPYNRPASSNENFLSPISEQDNFGSPMVSNPEGDDLESSNCAGDRSCNLDSTCATDETDKRSLSNISNNDDKENKKKRKFSSLESSPTDEISRDPYLKLIPKVHLLRLSNFMIDSDEPASNLNQVYSNFTERLFTRDITYVHRYQAKHKDDNEPVQASSDLKTKDFCSGQQQTIKEIINDYDDEDTVEMEFNSSDHCVILSSDDEEVSESPTVIKSEPWTFNRRLRPRTSRLLNQESKNESNKKILPSFELQQATKKAIQLERKRLRRRVQQKKLYESLFPNLVKYVSKTQLIFDIDIKKSSVRVKVQKQLAKVMKLYQLDGIKPR